MPSANAQTTPHEQYIALYKNVAVQEMKRSGVPASIKLAQGLLESQFGQSELAVHANNHFGIKCKSTWEGETYNLEDDDFEDDVLIKSCFRKYPDVLSSYTDHTNFLKSRSWYALLFELNMRDYKSWAYGLKAAGYATDPQYPQKLISRIEQWKLDRFDNEQPLDPIIDEPNIILPQPAQTIASVNGLKMVLARKGQTPSIIAKLTGVSLSEILKNNERLNNSNQVLERGEYVFLEEKSKKYNRGNLYHRATGTEDLYQISQRYGVTLERLAERNRMHEKAVPLKGERIKLRGWRVSSSKAPKWSFKVILPPVIKKEELIPTNITNFHTVQEDETLIELAQKYQTKVGRLRIMNQLTNDELKLGQVLRIR